MTAHRNTEWESMKRRLVLASIILILSAVTLAMLTLDARAATAPIEDIQPPVEPELEAVQLAEPVVEEPTVVERYAGISLSEADIELLAKIIWLESRGECFEGQQAVAEVILNRMVSEYFPDDLTSVIYEKDQFSTSGLVHKASPGNTQYAAIQGALYGPNILPKEVLFFSVKPQNDKIWGSIGGHVFCYPWFYGNE